MYVCASVYVCERVNCVSNSRAAFVILLSLGIGVRVRECHIICQIEKKNTPTTNAFEQYNYLIFIIVIIIVEYTICI